MRVPRGLRISALCRPDLDAEIAGAAAEQGDLAGEVWQGRTAGAGNVEAVSEAATCIRHDRQRRSDVASERAELADDGLVVDAVDVDLVHDALADRAGARGKGPRSGAGKAHREVA